MLSGPISSRQFKMPVCWHPDLMEEGIKLISDGTDNHMMLADLSSHGHQRKRCRKDSGTGRNYRKQKCHSV